MLANILVYDVGSTYTKGAAFRLDGEELTVAELAVAELAGAAGADSCMEVIRWSSLVAKMKYRS